MINLTFMLATCPDLHNFAWVCLPVCFPPPTHPPPLQIRNEQLSNIVRKVQGECDYVLKQAASAAEKQETLAGQLAKLTKSLEQTEESIKKSNQETKVCVCVSHLASQPERKDMMIDVGWFSMLLPMR